MMCFGEISKIFFRNLYSSIPVGSELQQAAQEKKCRLSQLEEGMSVCIWEVENMTLQLFEEPFRMLILCASKMAVGALLVSGLFKEWKQFGEVCSDTTISQTSHSLPWCQSEILQTLDCDSCQSNSDEWQLVKYHSTLLHVAVLSFAQLP